MRNPVKMEQIIKDLFELSGFSCKGRVCLKAIATRDGITAEAIIRTFPEFCRAFPIIDSYSIELDNPTLPPFFGESFEMNKLVLTYERSEAGWIVRIHTEEEEIPHGFLERLQEKLMERRKMIIEIAIMAWKILETCYLFSGQPLASSP